MRSFYKGDITVQKKDTDMKWAVTSGQLFYITSEIHKCDTMLLLKRPFLNHFKAFMYWLLKY